MSEDVEKAGEEYMVVRRAAHSGQVVTDFVGGGKGKRVKYLCIAKKKEKGSLILCCCS